jgi:hypothetical protein
MLVAACAFAAIRKTPGALGISTANANAAFMQFLEIGMAHSTF